LKHIMYYLFALLVRQLLNTDFAASMTATWHHRQWHARITSIREIAILLETISTMRVDFHGILTQFWSEPLKLDQYGAVI
jgi:hypothetical protein